MTATIQQMKRLVTVLLTAMCLIASRAGHVRAEDAGSSLGTLEGLVGEWIALREKIAVEKQEWEAQKIRWNEEISVLEAEKAALTTEIAKAREVTSSVEADRDRLSAEKAAMRQTVETIAPAVDRAEAVLRRWRDRLPVSLAAPLRKAFDELPASDDAARQTAVTRRLQRVIALYSQIEAMQHGIHVVREIIPLQGGTRREVDVVYIGLARGFAVSGDDRWAAVGTPSGSGWKWSARPELATTVRKAVDVAGNTVPAALVDLPLGFAAHEEGTASQ